MAEPAAPAPTQGAAKAPAATPAPSSPGPSLESRIAAAKTLSRSGVPSALPAEAGKAPPKRAAAVPSMPATPDPPADDDAASEPEEAEGAPDAAEELAETEGDGAEGGEDAGAEPGTAAERLAAITAALEKGDVEAFQKALGDAGKKLPVPTLRAFRSIARRELKLKREAGELDEARKKAQSDLSQESGRIVAMQRELARDYGFAKKGRDAWSSEEYADVGKALEAWLQTDLATITQKLATGKAGKTPTEKAVDQRLAALEKREREFEAKQKNAEGERTVTQQRAAAVSKVGEALKSHPYLVTTDASGAPALDREALEEVFGAYEKSWDGSRFTRSAKAIADELQAKLETRAKSRGLVKAEPAAAAPAKGKAGTPPAKKATPRARPPEPPRTGAPGASLDLEATRAMRIANAKRISEMQRRGLTS